MKGRGGEVGTSSREDFGAGGGTSERLTGAKTASSESGWEDFREKKLCCTIRGC